nr:hypothetical protein Iba_chr05aCG8380 [Ipomoea batatas]GMC95591.1 hypothetical protein Iba_chr05cCG10040 [Ipomoea batatas]GMC95595.1 hypothetical protein Iba_chr05cCG10080 [Ipomoea batatas]
MVVAAVITVVADGEVGGDRCFFFFRPAVVAVVADAEVGGLCYSGDRIKTRLQRWQSMVASEEGPQTSRWRSQVEAANFFVNRGREKVAAVAEHGGVGGRHGAGFGDGSATAWWGSPAVAVTTPAG